MDGACSMQGKDEVCMQNFSWKNGGEEIIGKLRSRSQDNIKIDFKSIGW